MPEYRDEQRAYLELAVLLVDLREAGKVSRIAELIHRAIPYPVLLILADSDGLMLSLAHIRWAQKEADKTVLEAGYPQMAQIGADKGNPDFHLRESALICGPCSSSLDPRPRRYPMIARSSMTASITNPQSAKALISVAYVNRF